MIHRQQHPIWMIANQRYRRLEMEMEMVPHLVIVNVAKNVNAVGIQMFSILESLIYNNNNKRRFFAFVAYFLDEVSTVLKNQNEILSLLTGLLNVSKYNRIRKFHS